MEDVLLKVLLLWKVALKEYLAESLQVGQFSKAHVDLLQGAPVYVIPFENRWSRVFVSKSRSQIPKLRCQIFLKTTPEDFETSFLRLVNEARSQQ